MTATNEGLDEDRAPGLGTAALSVLLGFVALFGLAAAVGVVAGMLAAHAFWGPWPWQPTALGG